MLYVFVVLNFDVFVGGDGVVGVVCVVVECVVECVILSVS